MVFKGFSSLNGAMIPRGCYGQDQAGGRDGFQVGSLLKESWNHGTIQVGKDHQDLHVQPQPIPLMPTDHVPMCHICTFLVPSWVGDPTASLGSPCQCIAPLLEKKLFQISNTNRPRCHLRPSPPVPTSPQPPLRALLRAIMSPLSPPFSRPNHPTPHHICAPDPSQLHSPLWTHSNTSTSFLVAVMTHVQHLDLIPLTSTHRPQPTQTPL